MFKYKNKKNPIKFETAHKEFKKIFWVAKDLQQVLEIPKKKNVWYHSDECTVHSIICEEIGVSYELKSYKEF